MKYIKPLDSIRAIAVFLVIIWHWLPRHSINKFPNGSTGVVIFFVLSGFLITRILLEGSDTAERTGIGRKVFFKNFYARRSLRIFPIYYLLVIPFFLYAIFTHQKFHEYYYLLTYTSNFYFFSVESWMENFSHTWSLAVEEQFYLVWPFIVLFINRRYLLTCILTFISIGIITEWIFDNSFGLFLPFTCFDSLGMGALLAWVAVYRRAFLKKFYKITGVISIAFVSLLYFEIHVWNSFIIPFRIQISVISLGVISYLVYTGYNHIKLPSLLNFILNNNLLVSFGKISYGVYLYHTFIPGIVWQNIEGAVYNHLPLLIKSHFAFFFFAFNFIILLIISMLSWQLIEKPILSLKKYFGYKQAATHVPTAI
ncbi:MAG: hypothetical protein JWP81_900 [Ferruginibacter sp.]|nr:hypothetical protein [Ferruginibacter sp.]